MESFTNLYYQKSLNEFLITFNLMRKINASIARDTKKHFQRVRLFFSGVRCPFSFIKNYTKRLTIFYNPQSALLSTVQNRAKHS